MSQTYICPVCKREYTEEFEIEAVLCMRHGHGVPMDLKEEPEPRTWEPWDFGEIHPIGIAIDDKWLRYDPETKTYREES